MPLIANIYPIRQAISKQLRDALDIYRKTIDEITVTIKRIESLGISVMQIIVGVTFTVFGFTVYYFIPQSILNNNLDLFFFVILLMLFAMLLGLIFIF